MTDSFDEETDTYVVLLFDNHTRIFLEAAIISDGDYTVWYDLVDDIAGSNLADCNFEHSYEQFRITLRDFLNDSEEFMRYVYTNDIASTFSILAYLGTNKVWEARYPTSAELKTNLNTEFVRAKARALYDEQLAAEAEPPA